MNQSRKSFLKILGLGSLGMLTGGAHSKENILKPPALKQGGTIGLVSPAGILPEPGRYEEINRTIQSMGFSIATGPHAKNRHGYFAGTDRERAEDFNAMFLNPSVDAILPYRGGWGSNRILEYIDFEQIRNHPKILVGFSDITSLLLAIFARTGLVTFHGPVGKSDWTDVTVSHFKQATMENSPFTLQQPSGTIRTITPGTARGVLAGGNLTVLTSMIGTGYLPDWNNKILFLEDVGEDFYRIDRMLTQLKMNGILDSVNAFIFGECSECRKGNSYSFTLEQILRTHVQPLKIPAFYGSMFGHISDMFTLPVGVEAEINAASGTITILESPTR